MEELGIEKVFFLLSILTFAIQQTIEIFDPIICKIVLFFESLKDTTGEPIYPGNLSMGDFKKSVITILSFIIALIIVFSTDLGILGLLNSDWYGGGPDNVITALVIGAGTENFNSVTKYLSYLKDNRKLNQPVQLVILPSSLTLSKNSVFQFSSNIPSTWKNLNQNVGQIDKHTGMYTAPDKAGTYYLQAVGKSDSSNSAIVAIKVVE